jgi:hypothetical protein
MRLRRFDVRKVCDLPAALSAYSEGCALGERHSREIKGEARLGVAQPLRTSKRQSRTPNNMYFLSY